MCTSSGHGVRCNAAIAKRTRLPASANTVTTSNNELAARDHAHDVAGGGHTPVEVPAPAVALDAQPAVGLAAGALFGSWGRP